MTDFPDGSNYDIIDTDYTSYSIVHSCDNIFGGLMYVEFVWFLAREPTISSTLYNSLLTKLKTAVPTYSNWFWRVLTWQGNALCYGTTDYGS